MLVGGLIQRRENGSIRCVTCLLTDDVWLRDNLHAIEHRQKAVDKEGRSAFIGHSQQSQLFWRDVEVDTALVPLPDLLFHVPHSVVVCAEVAQQSEQRVAIRYGDVGA